MTRRRPHFCMITNDRLRTERDRLAETRVQLNCVLESGADLAWKCTEKDGNP